MKWAWYGAITGGGRRFCRVWWGNRKKRVHLDVLGVDGKIKMILIFTM